MRKFENDYYDGLAGELASFNDLRELTEETLIHSRDPYAHFDFYSADCAIELKTRNCCFNTYPDVMIQMLKVMRCQHLPKEKQGILAFRFFDGLYYIKYNSTKFRHYRQDCITIPDREGRKEKPEPRIYIPKEHLTMIRLIDSKPLFLDAE